MKKMVKRKNVSWDVKNNGNGTILSIVVLHIFIYITLNLSINISHINKINHYDSSLEVAKIKAITRVKKEFYNQNCEDFTFEINNYVVNGVYDENSCTLEFIGEKNFEMKIIYDDIYLCIASIEYNFND